MTYLHDMTLSTEDKTEGSFSSKLFESFDRQSSNSGGFKRSAGFSIISGLEITNIKLSEVRKANEIDSSTMMTWRI